MIANPSFKTAFQWAFALSPFPSYLPQYFSITRRLASATDANDDALSASAGDSANGTVTETRGSVDRGWDHLRKRNSNDSPSIASSPNPGGLAGPTPGSPSKSFESEETDSGKLDAGLSRATVLLLLSAHLLRLLYFHGLVLEEHRPVPPLASAGPRLDELLTPAASSVPPMQTSALQWDLLGQSMSMIVVQVMLLHATMLLRRVRPKRQRIRRISGEISGCRSTDSLSSSFLTESSRSDSSISTSSPQDTNHNYNHNNSSNDNNSNDNNSGSTPFWQTEWRRLSRGTTAHFHNLLSPHSILQKHSFLEYLELLLLSSMSVKLVFDYCWYPMYRMQLVEGLKHTSICMESCLALPQIMRNYRRRTTEGLSAVMVGGWLAGDFFKLCYFLSGTIGGGDAEGTDNNVFALGCLVSITLDSIVGIQMALWYPEPGVLRMKQRVMRSVRHWKANK